MALITELENRVYKPFCIINAKNSTLYDNDLIRDQLVEELSKDSSHINYGAFPCETAVFMAKNI